MKELYESLLDKLVRSKKMIMEEHERTEWLLYNFNELYNSIVISDSSRHRFYEVIDDCVKRREAVYELLYIITNLEHDIIEILKTFP